MKHKFDTIELLENKQQVEDCQSLLDLLNKQCDKNVKMTFSKSRRGRAKISEQAFTMPKHALNKGVTYQNYYVIHEFTHCFARLSGHNHTFKKKEQELLSMFGITIQYARAYPKTLYCNGQQEYERSRTKNK